MNKAELVALQSSVVFSICKRLLDVNIGGRGVSDAQKALIAAVETECVSKQWANSVSNLLKLGLNWEEL